MNGKNIVAAMAGLGAVVLIAGCEWQGGGSAGSFSDRYSWANLSGVYRGVSGGLLVTDYSALPGDSDITNRVPAQVVGTADGVKLVYTGIAGKGNLVDSTFVMEAGDMYWYDSGGGSLTAIGTGAVDSLLLLDTGAWRIETTIPIPAGTPLVVRYAETIDSDQTDINKPGAGSSGIKIFAFTVVQEGNTLTITDNNGSTYTGSFGSVSTNTGANRDTPISSIVPVSGTQIIAQFNVKGVSAAGRNVVITGFLQGDAAVAVDATTGATTVTTTNRIMVGSWIEQPGKTGDINGAAQ